MKNEMTYDVNMFTHFQKIKKLEIANSFGITVFMHLVILSFMKRRNVQSFK